MTPLRSSLRFVLPALASVWGCADSGGIVDPDTTLVGSTVILSDPGAGVASSSAMTPSSRSARAVSFAAAAAEEESDVAYVSLEPGKYPEGAIAEITSPRITGSVLAPMIDGGLDPVPVAAAVGDSVEIEILREGGASLASVRLNVPVRRRPRVVRTIPPRGKTDVAINATIVVVFSEPVAANSLSPSSVRLLQGTTAVAGTARVLEGVTAAAIFQPTEILSPNTPYRLVVSQGVRDLDGDPLEAEVVVDFTVGTTFAPRVSRLTVLPDITALRSGSQVQMIVRATGGDDTTRIPVPIAGVPILWSSENSAVATVSMTGLVTAIAVGEARIRAQVLTDLTVSASAFVFVSASLPSVASLDLSPPTDTTPTSGKIELSVVTRDSVGNVLQYRAVSWRTTNSEIATVDPAPGGKAWVTGISSGSASIIATSDGKSDTVAIDVVDPGPYTAMSVAGVTGNLITCGLRSAGWAFCWGWNSAGQVGDGTSNSWMLPRAVARAIRFPVLRAGGGNTCALDADANAYCWGTNALGSLGIGTISGPEECQFAGPCSRIPIAVSGALRFRRIDVNDDYYRTFVCGLTGSGAAYCWGGNSSGELGVGTTSGPEACAVSSGFDPATPCSTVPVAVAGPHQFRSIALGGMHACALTDTGVAYCWGDNSFGQLGDGTTTDRSAPVLVIGGLIFTSIDAGYTQTCGVTADGDAYCWGGNAAGALGYGAFAGPESCYEPPPGRGGPFDCSMRPVRVSGTARWASVAAGTGQTCGLTVTGTAYCWGANDFGQLGTGTTESSPSPVAVVGGLTFANLTAAGRHACGVTTNGIAFCWGSNEHYALGNDDTFPGSTVPIRVEGQP